MISARVVPAILFIALACAMADAQAPAGDAAKPAAVPTAPDSARAVVQVPADTAKVKLPPAPMRNVITTEKLIKGLPSGIVPKRRAVSGTVAEPTSAAPVAPAPAPGTVAAKADTAKAGAVRPPGEGKKPAAPSTPARKKSDTYREELSLFNSPAGDFRTMKIVIDDEYNLVGMVYGETLGFIRILNADNDGGFTEVWKSPPLNSEVRGIYIRNLDKTGEAEIVAYTAEGNIFIFGYDTHEMKYKTPDGTYGGINCMVIADIDNSPELELLFISKAGKMVQFDPVTKFEEWKSTETYTASDMVIGNVDGDPDPEIILNTGEILNVRFKSVKWKLDSQFIRDNMRLYLIDMDSDGILELVVEYDNLFVRIFDVDQRREKW